MCIDSHDKTSHRKPAIFRAEIDDLDEAEANRKFDNLGPTNDTDHIFDAIFDAVWRKKIRQRGQEVSALTQVFR